MCTCAKYQVQIVSHCLALLSLLFKIFCRAEIRILTTAVHAYIVSNPPHSPQHNATPLSPMDGESAVYLSHFAVRFLLTLSNFALSHCGRTTSNRSSLVCDLLFAFSNVMEDFAIDSFTDMLLSHGCGTICNNITRGVCNLLLSFRNLADGLRVKLAGMLLCFIAVAIAIVLPCVRLVLMKRKSSYFG